MRVGDVMTAAVVEVSPDEPLREACVRMTERNVGSALVRDDDGTLRGILTERDAVHAVAAGVDPAIAPARAHATGEVVTTRPDASLGDAAATMLRGGFGHLVVVDGAGAPVGVLSSRDVLRVWTAEHLPAM